MGAVRFARHAAARAAASGGRRAAAARRCAAALGVGPSWYEDDVALAGRRDAGAIARVVVSVGGGAGDESYALRLAEGDDVVRASAAVCESNLQYDFNLWRWDGARHALPSAFDVEDAPRHAWRGLLLDTSRHFWPLARAHRALDAMEALKLNVLHWHVVDSQSWPWAANATAPRPYCGACVYTSADVAAVAAAAGPGIAVVRARRATGARRRPRRPARSSRRRTAARSRAAGARRPRRRRREHGARPRRRRLGAAGAGWTTRALRARRELAAAAGAAHVHVGGDEVDAGCWAETRRARARRAGFEAAADWASEALLSAADAARAAGATPVFWDDALDAGDPATLAGGLVQIWRGWLGVPGLLAYASTLGLAGAIVSDGMYLDYDHEGWDQVLRRGRLPDHALVVGGEACSWGEHNERLDARLVKLAAAAERLWGGAAADAARAGDLPSGWARCAWL
ncbi:N-acetyl-beta-D-galactosaminidase [Aureococcus anophagefferens]|nr:N-acetyl-beta-D-galactosaminidase [Aureococcus anophagefferens]